MVEYNYDAWGATLTKTGSMAGTLGVHNPFRYRGYVFDLDTGLYYLRSRYYNPKWGRFINADVVLGKRGALLSHNLFAYCGNEPIIRVDPTGCAWYDFLTDSWSWISSKTNDAWQSVIKITDSVRSWMIQTVSNVSDWWQNTVAPWWDSVLENNKRAVEIEAELTYNISQNIGNWWKNTVVSWWNSTLEANRMMAEIDAEIKYYAVQNISSWITSVSWKNIGKQTFITGIAGGIGGAVTGAASGMATAPATAGTSMLVAAGTGFVIGFIGGLAEGFVQSFLEEVWQ